MVEVERDAALSAKYRENQHTGRFNQAICLYASISATHRVGEY